MLDGPFRVTSNQPVDQEIADVMSAMMNFAYNEYQQKMINELVGEEYAPTSGEAKILNMRRYPNA